ncbi:MULTISPECIES: nucleotidyltransferase domain-containing protein [Burkholderia cepacia complex]|uniref:nucleotidyltransferase domain-containing protein n=1 Tax=Burkholderia cepacia complex TaxID=87882 RepID=UPI001CF4EE2A|nr:MULTISPECIES: nucleotidyltransferase [Burkholderia cepacia complex]MCA8057140.1 nucleotidyltransferase [Burkholderia cepacia]MDN7534670.1 nucleotidyltransferase [Burkholderia orbicola]
MTTNLSLSKRVIAALNASSETQQWETLIARLLRRLELDPADRARAEADYAELADDLAKKLSIPRHDVHIFPQGSMRTQTTISQRYPVNFDLDLVVKLTGPYYNSPDPEVMFAAFGKALEGNEAVTGEPDAKRRCWRLGYPGRPYYFDLTPAVRDQTGREGSSLSVRDPDTRWVPSNPEEFADWFCTHAARRFVFQSLLLKSKVEARTTVTPLPDEEVGLDDILRRTVQLMKLHRDTTYWGVDEKKKDVMPISVIIVTLATKAYADLHARRGADFSSPIEVVLALIEAMPTFIEKDHRGWRVENPKLKGENFADKWNSDDGARAREFARWHAALERDLDALLHQSHRSPSEDKIRSVFGTAGVEAWKASRPKASVLDGLISSADGYRKTNPDQPVKTGSSNTLG